MHEYRSNVDQAGVVERMRLADKVMVTTHTKPDGDAFGSVVALAGALRALGKEVTAWFMPPVPANLADLGGGEGVQAYDPSKDLGQPDLVVVLDTGASIQLSPMHAAITPLLGRTVVVDHHLSGDLAAAWRYVDPHAAACSEIVAELIDLLQQGYAGEKDLYSPAVCEALFVGIASDTGWFRFSNTRPQTHELAARLMRKGVNSTDLYRKTEQRARPEKLALQTRALDSLQLLADNRVAIMVLRAGDFEGTGAILEETERFVDMPQSVATVQLVVLITETPPHHHHHHPQPGQAPGAPSAGDPNVSSGQPIRLSFRSKPGPKAVNVAALAQQLGGGGHARAAGAKVRMPLESVIEKVTSLAVAAVTSV